MKRWLSLGCALALVGCSSPEERTRVACAEAAPALTAGFGARGPHAVEVATFPSPALPSQLVSVHLPQDASGPVPVVLFGHAFATADPRMYRAFLDHIASRGYAVVFAPYMVDDPRNGPKYDALWEGLRAGVEAHRAALDLSRIGIVGHSYGAGAAPFVALRAVAEGWGGSGLFLHLLAPFYPLRVETAELAGFPQHAKVLIQVFEEDNATDHRIAIALYEDLGVGEKDYLLVRSDGLGRCRLPALHTVPQSQGLGARDDALDERAVWRLFDALAAFTFEGDDAGRRVALGRGAPEQVSMGTFSDGSPMRDLVWRERPEPSRAEGTYIFKQSHRDAWASYGEAKPGAAAPGP